MFHSNLLVLQRRTIWIFTFSFALFSLLVFWGPKGSAEKSASKDAKLGSISSATNIPSLRRGARLSRSAEILFSAAGRLERGNLLLPLASTITVNSTAQSPGIAGDCTLGEAIRAINTHSAVDGCSANAGTSTIILPAGTYRLTAADSLPSTGLPNITSNVTIQGDGAATTIIERDPNAAALFRLMAVSNSGSLVLNDVTLRGGRSDDLGGAVVADGPTTLNNVVCNDNTAPNGGGAIEGGNSFGIIINNCTFENNRATNSFGGAIYAPFVTVNGSMFTGNQAATHGGAIFYNQGAGARFNITDSTFINNKAMNGNGGALYASGYSFVSGSLFDGNVSGSEGGAIWSALYLNISDSVVINNHANADGGITRNEVGTSLGGGFESLFVNRCNISNNTSNHTAGGVYVQGGSGNISNSTISGNMAGSEGGGIFAFNALVNLTNDTFDGNTATQGGGILYQDLTGVKPLTLNNVTVSANRATNYGGGIFRSGGTINLKNTIVALNLADSGFAPDLYESAPGIISLGYNLIGIKEPSTFTNATGDQTGTGAAQLNPLLGALQDNGGST
ncbi:MAG: hypothetical protein ABR607_02015, partial [Pyrinomonadaceae bacterium]